MLQFIDCDKNFTYIFNIAIIAEIIIDFPCVTFSPPHPSLQTLFKNWVYMIHEQCEYECASVSQPVVTI